MSVKVSFPLAEAFSFAFGACFSAELSASATSAASTALASKLREMAVTGVPASGGAGALRAVSNTCGVCANTAHDNADRPAASIVTCNRWYMIQ